jgi:hypothetical protein
MDAVTIAIVSAASDPRHRDQLWSLRIVSLLFVAAAFVTLTDCSPAVAQDQHLTKTAKAAHDVIIMGYARSDQSCRGIEPPTLTLDKPPDHGTVCFRVADMKLSEAIVGNLTQCLGLKIRGVSVVYLPRWGYTGPDDLRYTVVFPEARHSVYVDLTVLPEKRSSAYSVPADISAPSAESPQPSGAIPACTALVS